MRRISTLDRPFSMVSYVQEINYLSKRFSSAAGMIVLLSASVLMILTLDPRPLSLTFCSANFLDLASISVARNSHEER